MSFQSLADLAALFFGGQLKVASAGGVLYFPMKVTKRIDKDTASSESPPSRKKHPQMIAHRGASANAPENTLAAFRLAWDEGADGIEGDFHLTADGEVVCTHDATTARCGGADLEVAASTLAELRELDFGAWKGPEFAGERIPTLEEILDQLPLGKWLFIEIKDTPRTVTAIAKILRDRNVDTSKVVLISFRHEIVQACRSEIPECRAGLISKLKEFENWGKPQLYLEKLEQSGAQGLLFKEDAPVTRRWLKSARGKDRLLMAWTVDRKESALKMSALGVDFIISNRPGELRAEIEE